MSMNGPARRGRPHLDFAIRLRNWGWYWLVRDGSPLSDDGLDKKYVKTMGDDRPRFFFQIRKVGSSPDELRGLHSRKSIYECVHEGGQHPRAKRWFESKLWWFLTNPDLRREDFSAYIHDEIGRRGWFRATPGEAGAANWVFANEGQVFSSNLGIPSASGAYAAMIRHLRTLPDVEGITLLSALFREAYYDVQLDLAKKVGDALDDAIQDHIGTLPIGPKTAVNKAVITAANKSVNIKANVDVRRCLEELIRDRMINNIWINEPDMPVTPYYKKATRAKQIRLFNSWYLRHDNGFRNFGPSVYPIVLETARTRWFRKHRSRIKMLHMSQRPLDSADFEDAMRNGWGNTPEDISRTERRVDRIQKRSEYDPVRDARARKHLRKLGEIPARDDCQFLPDACEDGDGPK